MNKKYFLALCLFIVFIILYFNWRSVHIKWVEIFKQDALFFQYNSEGRIDGEVRNYINGKIYVIGNVVNGVKQGWETMFYENGKVKSKTFFVNGEPSGKGYLYTDNGKLIFSGSYRYDGRYGSWYSYYENGHIKEYFLYDIYKNIAFSLGYENDGKMNLKDMDGYVISPYLYSINLKSKAITPLDHKTSPDMSFKDINDLYITVSNAPKARLDLKLSVNSTSFTFKNVNSSTLKVPNVFLSKGRYNIQLVSDFYNENDQHVNGMNIKYSLEIK